MQQPRRASRTGHDVVAADLRVNNLADDVAVCEANHCSIEQAMFTINR
jgi:hypothetical protein